MGNQLFWLVYLVQDCLEGLLQVVSKYTYMDAIWTPCLLEVAFMLFSYAGCKLHSNIAWGK